MIPSISTRLRALFLFAVSAGALLAQQSTKIDIGTWNIEFLGAAPNLRRDAPPRTDEDLQAIGRKIKELGVAVLAVQEICGEAPLREVVKAIAPSWRFLLGTTGSWDDGKTQQGIGFLYDSAVVELLSAEELLDFPRERDGIAVFHRKPVTACFRCRATGCDFRLVTVHLKAGQKSQDQEKRRIEAITIREWLDRLQADPREDPDVLVMGDFNCTYGDEPERLLEQGGAMQYLESRTKRPSIIWFADPIDQIVVAKGFAEVQRDSMVVHEVTGEPERLAWRKTYSDHFPVIATITSSRDDDPDATFWHGPQSQRLPVDQRPVAVASTATWPPAVGTMLSIGLGQGLGGIQGKLVEPFPEGTEGWIQLEVGGRHMAVAVRQVVWISFE